MKKYINKASGWFAAATLLLATSCSNETLDNPGDALQDTDLTSVTLTLGADLAQITSRADDELPSQLVHIGTGSQIDMLIYAIYDANQNVIEKYGTSTSEVAGFTPSAGQTIKKLNQDEINNLTLKLDEFERSKTYYIVCWAQSSLCTDYNTTDLKQIKVKYTGANNNETRDAFTASLQFVVTGDANNFKVILKRPFAQVNVGTTGYDYEGVAVLKPSPISYTKSTVSLKGAAQYFNALESKVMNADDLEAAGIKDSPTTDVTFSMSYIPAFINIEQKENLDYWVYDPTVTDYIGKIEKNEGTGAMDTTWISRHTELEQPLEHYLHINYREGSDGYMTWDRFLGHKRNDLNFNAADAKWNSRDLKYLSMCYVLVPEPRDLTEDDNVANVSYGSVLNTFKCTVEGNLLDGSNAVDNFDIELSNIPVQRNWRTNIVSTSLFLTTAEFMLYVVPDYAGDRNNINDKWMNDIEFDDTDNNNWKLKDPEAGNPNDDFRDPAGDYHEESSQNQAHAIH